MIRKPAYAGTWYPGEPAELRKIIERFLNKAKRTDVKGVRGLVVPHAGLVYSGIVAAAGYRLLRAATRVFLLGSSHYAAFSGIARSGAAAWATPLGNVKVFEPKFDTILSERAHAAEHCLEIQLPFLQVVLKDFSLCPLLLSEIEPARLAKALSKELDERTIIIASSDLSHHHAYEEAKRIDAIANSSIPALDIKTVKKKVQACGKPAILTLMRLARIKGWKGQFIDYKNSGDTAGDKNFVVGYGCYAFLK